MWTRTSIVLCLLFSGIVLDYSETKAFFDRLLGYNGVTVARVPAILSGIFKREACRLIEKDTASFTKEALRAIRNIRQITLLDYSGCDSSRIAKLESDFKAISGTGDPQEADANIFFSSSGDEGCSDRAVLHSPGEKSFIVFKGKFDFIPNDEP